MWRASSVHLKNELNHEISRNAHDVVEVEEKESNGPEPFAH